MVWSEWRVHVAVRALKIVMDLADLDDDEMDVLTQKILPKFIRNSGLSARAFQAIVREMHREDSERLATRH
jgi:hypothetical protein